MSNYEIIAAGLEFPEGPVVMPDGSIVLVEIKRGTITRVDPDDGSVDVLAQPGEDQTVRRSARTVRYMCAITVGLNGAKLGA